MKTRIALWMVLGILLTGCDAPFDTQPIVHPKEAPEAVTNDFTLVKACLAKSEQDVAALMTEKGYSRIQNKTEPTYTKTENDITKTITILGIGNVSMTVKDESLDVLKSVYKQWLNEYHSSASYTNMVRASYGYSKGYYNRASFSTPEELIAALDTVTFPADNNITASLNGNDLYANTYAIYADFRSGTLYLQIYNLRTGQPEDEFTESDLRESDLKKNILICRVDYLTFGYKGFYAMNITDPVQSGEEIPIISEYHAPSDFGDIKLFYNTSSNLLMSGSIVWNGSGKLAFPEKFRAGLPLSEGIAFPGTERFARLAEDGKYTGEIDESEVQKIWQTVSKQKEFQHYYGNSKKKIAIYLYTPSVGVMDPYSASYFVFVEQ